MKVFFFIFLAIVTTLGYFLGAELIQPLSRWISVYILWSIHIILFFIMALSPILYRVFQKTHLSKGYQFLQRFAYILMGFYFLLMTLVLIKISFLDKFFSEHLIILTIILLSITLTCLGFFNATKVPELKKVNVPIPGLPEEFYQLKMIQLSDVHVGQNIGKKFLEKIVRVIENEKPDILFLTGDLIDGYVDHLRAEFEPFKRLNPSLGIYYIPGNHEYYWEFENWMNFFKNEMNYNVLLNSSIDLKIGNYKLKIAGVHDLHAHRINANYMIQPDLALEGDEVLLKILLAHQPNSIFKLKRNRADLILSGHTHAGQFFPANLLIYLFQKFVKGLYRFKDSWIYVNQGTGFWGPPNRLGTTSEITLLRFSKRE